MAILAVTCIAFVLGFVGSMPLAGPISLLVVSRGAERRFDEARRIAFGAATAEGIYAFVAFWGFATFLAQHRSILPWSKGLTAVVLLAVGGRFLGWKPAEGSRDVEAPPDSRRAGRSPFMVGFTLSMLNPTLLATWSAVTTALYSKQFVTMTSFMAVPFGAAAAAGIALWNVVIVALLERFQKRVPTAVMTWVVRGMGLLLVAIAVWSGVDLVLHRAA